MLLSNKGFYGFKGVDFIQIKRIIDTYKGYGTKYLKKIYQIQ